MGIGLDADITLEFHQTREAFPDRFQSRMFNKTYYFKSFLSQIPNKSKYINNVITLKAENRPINLPNIQGLIFDFGLGLIRINPKVSFLNFGGKSEMAS